MKDNVGNRRRVPLAAKLRIIRIAARENGLFWLLRLAVYYAASQVGNMAYESMVRTRQRRGVPGLNSPALNKMIWESWDWSGGGDEWTSSEEWKSAVIDGILRKYIPQGARVLEIGPGAGRWTSELLARARSYVGIDISSTCVELCRQRFSQYSAARFVVGTGSDLPTVERASIDAVWSFDVFVHINDTEVGGYIAEFLRVMSPGAIAVIHHGTVGGSAGGWRSNLTAKRMTELLRDCGFVVVASFDKWQAGATTFEIGPFSDAVTVFQAPGAKAALPAGGPARA